MIAEALFIGLGFISGGAAARLLLDKGVPRADVDLLREELRELSDRYSTLTSNIAAGILVRDRLGGLVFCSPYTEVLTGYPRARILAHSGDFLEAIMHPDDKEKYRRALRLGELGEPFQVRFRITHQSGMEIWLESRTVPILDQRGDTAASLTIALDVTSAVRAQRQVEEKNRDLRDFTSMVSHDLKAPINTIRGMLQIVNEELPAESRPSGVMEALGHMQGSVTRLEQLVRSVLEYARISAQEFSLQAISLQETLAEVERDFAAQLETEKGTLHFSPGLPQVMGEHVRCYQVFSNLVGNSLKYAEPGRAPAVTIHEQPGRTDREITIVLSDNGRGIPAEKLQDIFRPFYRAHEGTAEGSGIGLACVKRVMEKCGGDVRVESAVGVGTKFFLTFLRA